MNHSLTVPAAIALSLVLAVPVTSAVAQTAPTPSQSEQDHSAHHPGGAQSAAPAPVATPNPASQSGSMGMMGQQGGQPADGMMGADMMSGGMGRMMTMMHGGGMIGGMPFEHVEGRLAFLKTELKITPAQEPQWNKFADAVRSVAQSMRSIHEKTMQDMPMKPGGMQSATARLDHYEHMLSARLEAVRTIKAAFDPLYASLSDEQKKTADELSGPMMIM